MRHRRLHFRHRRFQEFLGLAQIGDARRDIEALAAAIMLAQQRLAHHQRIERRHEGAHRQPVDRRRGDQRQIAHARQRQLQGARDRRRGQRQHMDIGLQRSSAVPCAPTPKCCSSSTITRPRRLNSMLFGQQRMGADDDIDRRRRPAPPWFRVASLASTKRDSCRTLSGKPAKRSAKAAIMLARQQRGRHHHRHLLARHGGDEGGAQRHFGLAEADIAADQPVHRPALAPDRRWRRRWLFPGPRSPDRESGRRIRHTGRAADRPAAAISARARRRCGSARRRSRAPAPSSRALRCCQPAPPSRSSCAPLVRAVAGQELDILHRQEQLAAVILQLQAVMRRAQRVDGLEAEIAARRHARYG